MVNIYNKGGYKNPSIPKPSGGYSSLVKPATAPMRQGGLSQLAAKAAMQGRQPAAGNPPIPQTGRAPVAPPRAVESVPPGAAPPPTPRPQYGAVTPQVAPTVPPVQGGMLGAITQGLRAPQGQARGMVGAAAEAVAPRIPGWLTPQLAGGLLGGASKPGAGEEDYTYADLWGALGGEGGTSPEDLALKQMYQNMIDSGYAGPSGEHQSAASEAAYNEKKQRDELIASGTDPMMADLIIQLTSGEYGYSDEEKAKMIAKGSGQQAEMMAARGLGASGLAGTGFGDIYSKVMSDAADLEASQTLQSQKLLADLLGQQQEAEAAATQEEKDFALGLAIAGGGDKVDPSVYSLIAEMRAGGMSDEDIAGHFVVDGKTLKPFTDIGGEYQGPEGVEKFLAEFGPPPKAEDYPNVQAAENAFWAWAENVKAQLGTTHASIREFLEANGIEYFAGNIDEYTK